jgi:hypothetical protein
MNRETAFGAGAPSFAVAKALRHLATTQPDDAIRLDSCRVFEWIVVRTRRSVYDIIVLAGKVGEVMVRGGRFFPEFRRARFAGSTAGGSALKLRSICVGLNMELNVDGKRVVTSKVQAISDRVLHGTPNEDRFV